jgi:hypothetical protein
MHDRDTAHCAACARQASGGYAHLVGQAVDALITSARRWCPTFSVPEGWKVFLDVNDQISLGELAAQTLNLGQQGLAGELTVLTPSGKVR